MKETYMKSTALCALLLASAEAFGQGSWSQPIRITSGNDDEFHPTVADGFGWLSNSEEMLAYSRNGKDICILQTTSIGASWSDNVIAITTDSADNDFPSLVRPSYYSPQGITAMLVWQGRRGTNLEILYSRLVQGQWSGPEAITNNSIDDQHPHVGCNDSTFYVVWEQQGSILYSEYALNNWNTPLRLTEGGDTLNHLPQVGLQYQYPPPSDQPFVVWQRRKPNTRFYSLIASFRTSTGWSAPDTLLATGDNRRPRFFKYNYPGYLTLTWDTRVDSSTRFTTYGGNIWVSSGRATLGNISPLNSESDSIQNASVNGFMIITRSNPLSFLYSAGAWELPGNDSIGVGLHPIAPFGISRLSPIGAALNRNPTISQGTPASGGFWIRFWAVWEALVNNRWQLYASNAILIVDDVTEHPEQPSGFALHQNYPNPFNPTTTIRYSLPSHEGDGVRSHVTLKVFDVLGREVATLVDDKQEPGEHTTVWNPGQISSGVYFYRLVVGQHVEIRKAVFIR